MGKTTYPPGATFCRTCGYCLFGLPSNTCPECGHGFDPADPATFLSRPRRRGLRRAIFWGLLGMLVLSLAYGGFLTWLYVGWRAEAGARALPTGKYGGLKTRSILPSALSHLVTGDCRQWQERADDLTIWDRPLSSHNIHSIAACRRLRVLELRFIPLRTEDVVELCGCRELEELSLIAAALHRGDLTPVQHLADLKNLWVGGNTALGDEDLAAIGKLQALESVDFSDSAITDEGLAQLSELNHLHRLSLQFCPNLTDAAVPHLSRLRALELLNLGGSKLTRAAVDQLRKNLPGCKIYDP